MQDLLSNFSKHLESFQMDKCNKYSDHFKFLKCPSVIPQVNHYVYRLFV